MSREERFHRRNVRRVIDKLKQTPDDVQRNISHFTSLCGTENTPCDASSHAALVNRLLTFCTDKNTVLSHLRLYSQNCLRDVIQSLETEVGDTNVFESGVNAYGMWWLANRGVVRTDMTLSRGLLYIHVEPWVKQMRVVSLIYNQNDLQVPVLFNHVKYGLDNDNNVSGSWQNGIGMQKTFPFPNTVQRICTMEQVLDRFVDESVMTSDFELVPAVDMFTTRKELVLMFYKLVNEDTDGPLHYNDTIWEINIHRFPEKNKILLWYI